MKRLPPPLSFSIPGVLLVFGALVLAVSLHFELAEADRRAEAAIVQRAQLLSTVLSAELEKAYRERRPNDARGIVLQASADRALRRAIMFDEDRRALETTPLGLAGQMLADTPFAADTPSLEEMRRTGSTRLRIVSRGDRLASYVPVLLRSAGELLPTRNGVLAMEFDLAPIRSEGRALVVRRAIVTAIALGAICTLLWLFFQFSLLRRVQALIAVTRQFAAGDVAARASLGGSDEMAQMSRAFNQMAEAIALSRQALVESERHATFLAEVSRRLATVFDAGAPLDAVARSAVPLLGDVCLVRVPDHGSVAVMDADRGLDAVLRTHPGSAPGGALLAALESGETQMSPPGGQRLAEALGLTRSQEPELATALDIAGSYMVVPLQARGRAVGVIAFVSADVRRYEDPRLVALAEDMAQRAALSIDNSLLYRQAQEAVRARDEFLMVASHELRTPCTSLRLAVEFLRRAGATLPPHKVEAMLDVTDRESKHLAMLVDRLLDVSRMAVAELELVLEPVDLAAITREVVIGLAGDLERTGSTVVVEADETVVGRWDRERIRQVVTILLVNAVRYGRGRPVRVRVTAVDQVARLEVIDQGIGIAPGHQARIFDRFERAVSTRHYGGLGLGLYIVRRIVEALGGTIGVTSELDVGSTFTVDLPRGLDATELAALDPESDAGGPAPGLGPRAGRASSTSPSKTSAAPTRKTAAFGCVDQALEPARGVVPQVARDQQ
ncbi:ATP-binding protein [Nannocystis radixulma]|uniref:histidine kinase n=1 Tax=Nannocystis radixulma TaxID=2995305 RepID=A0ABT5AWE9_9BACT|nr:ATP-binding protein [Nannocystis radixulma]MDC0666167.1 ATP-binding protein [Nannocystis radixulma]